MGDGLDGIHEGNDDSSVHKVSGPALVTMGSVPVRDWTGESGDWKGAEKAMRQAREVAKRLPRPW